MNPPSEGNPNRNLEALGALFFFVISTFLAFFYAFFVPSLGHLQEFDYKEGIVNLDHLTPWGMVLSAVLIATLHQSEKVGGAPKTLFGVGVRPILFFVVMWAERTVYIARQIGSAAILIPFFLSLIWIPLFLKGTMVLCNDIRNTEKAGSSHWGAEWGPRFFWTSVFFSFSVQLVLNGYGNWGSFQALMFLSLSYLEYRKILSIVILSSSAIFVFQWAFRSVALLYFLIFISKFLRYL